MSDRLTDAYNEVRVNNHMKKMILEGKSPEDVEKFLKEAGLWDRMKANASSAIQKVKNAPSAVSGYAKQGVANVAQKGVNAVSKGLNNLGVKTDATQANQKIQDLKQAGQQQVQNAGQASVDAKVNSIFQSHSKDLDTLMQAIVIDIQKLNIPLARGLNPVNMSNIVKGQIRSALGLGKAPQPAVQKQQPPANVATTNPTPVGTAPQPAPLPPTAG